MKRMIMLLSAATLALVPFVSNAKKPPNISDYELEVLECSCDSAAGLDDEVMYTCDVSWTDAIADAVNPATYGASIDVDVEWEEDGIAMEGSESVELDYDWTEVCDAGSCTVEDVEFMLTNYTDQTVTLKAAIKAFNNRSEGRTPRNVVKSTLDCTVNPT